MVPNSPPRRTVHYSVFAEVLQHISPRLAQRTQSAGQGRGAEELPHFFSTLRNTPYADANKDDITATPTRRQSCTLEHVGNRSEVISQVNGADHTPYDVRSRNTVNEIATIDPQGAAGHESALRTLDTPFLLR